MGMLKDMAIQDGFICDHCELPLPQSPTWEEFCIYCTIEMLRNDIEINASALKEKEYEITLTWETVL
jgi:hypothetical protein